MREVLEFEVKVLQDRLSNFEELKREIAELGRTANDQ